MAKVIATRKDEKGGVLGFKLDDGREIDYEQCVQAIDNGEIPDLMHIPTKAGTISIRSMPDGDPSNNLTNLPDF